MTLYLAAGSPTHDFSQEELDGYLEQVLQQLGPRQRVLAVPPDFTRFHSQAGPLTCLAQRYYGDQLVDVMPALGHPRPHDPRATGAHVPRFTNILDSRTSLAR